MRVRYKRVTAILRVQIEETWDSDEEDDRIIEEAFKRWKNNQPTINSLRVDTGINQLTCMEIER